MPTQNLTTYTEVDPNSRVTKTADRVSWAAITRNEDAYLYYDMDVDHFDGDFEHLLDVYIDAGDDTGLTFVNSLQNAIDDAKGIYDANGFFLAILLRVTSGQPAEIRIWEMFGTDKAYEDIYAVSLDTTYYLKFKRDEDVGTYGTLYCYIYSDAARTNLLGTLSVTLHGKRDFRYHFALNTFKSGSAASHTGYAENFNLQEPVIVTSSVIIGVAVSASRTIAITRTSSVIVGVLVSASRVVAITRKAAVPIGVLVSASRIAGYVRTASVIVGVKVTASRTLGIIRSATIQIGVVVTASRIAGYIRKAAVSVGVKPAASRAIAVTRASSVAIGVAVSASRKLAIIKTASVIVGVKATASQASRLFKHIQDFTGRIVKTFTGRDIQDDTDHFRKLK